VAAICGSVSGSATHYLAKVMTLLRALDTGRRRYFVNVKG